MVRRRWIDNKRNNAALYLVTKYELKMDVSEFLFPSDLQRTPSNIKSVLIIGSCLAEVFKEKFNRISPEINFDYILFNNISELPDNAPHPLSEYDFHYIQIPLRSVLSDAIVRFDETANRQILQSLLDASRARLEMMLNAALKYHRESNTPAFVTTFVTPQGRAAASMKDHGTVRDFSTIVHDLNRYLAELVAEEPNVFLADVNTIADSMGRRYFLDDTIYFYMHGSIFYPDWADFERFPAWAAPERGRIEVLPNLGELYENHIDEFFAAVLRQLESLYRTLSQIDQVKVVIFDLDNTLWRGQIAEHYLPGRTRPYSDGWPTGIWETVHYLRARGIFVSICSKNDFDVVAAGWDDAVNPPFVKLSDFIVPKINWKSKAENIAEILEDLSLTPHSAVFIDDNPVEREWVRTAFPDIRVIGDNPFTTRRILLWAAETQVARLSVESQNREITIKSKIERDIFKRSVSREEFLGSLGCVVTIIKISSTNEPQFGRFFELLNKTNQFNTTGRRWTLADCQHFFDNGGSALAFKVNDRFAEYGLVGALLVQNRLIEQFVMSCRVLGMDVEGAVVAEAVRRMRGADGGSIMGRLVATAINTPCQQVYANAGMLVQDGDETVFELASEQAVKAIPHITIYNGEI